jgi:hypothetical protein
MFKLKPKKKEEPPQIYKFVPLKPNPALAMGAIAPPAPKVFWVRRQILLFSDRYLV